MPERVFVHIGLPKTGTTYLQNLMYANRDAFRAQGVTVIGRPKLQYDAASEVTRSRPPRLDTLPQGKWQRVQELVADADTSAVVFSHERYSLARSKGVPRIAEAFADHELHVIMTVRDPIAAEPSAWQEAVKNGDHQTWHEYCSAMVADPTVRARDRARAALELWPLEIPEERLHVITVPPPGSPHTLIFEQFCSVLGVDPSAMDTLEAERRNTSLDFVATEMLRRLNLLGRLSIDAHRVEIKQWLANGVLAEQPSTSRPALEGPALELVRGELDWVLDRLRHGGFDVVGDLADLTRGQPPAETAYDVTPAEVLDVALEALALMTERSYDRELEIRDLKREARRLSLLRPERLIKRGRRSRQG